MRRLLPSPLLSLGLFLLWLVLNRSVEAGVVLIAAVLAILAPILTVGLRPAPVRIRHPLLILKLIGYVTADLLRSNLAVARAILTRGNSEIPSAFVRIPLEMRDPNALAVLAMIICATPGTAWAEVAFGRRVLMIHVLEVHDEAEVVATIKNRYERLLREIFE